MAPSMPEAMKRIRAELGEQAVILNSRMVYSGGFLGLFKKKNIEVIAAMDPEVNHLRPQLKDKPKIISKDSVQPRMQPIDEEKDKETLAITKEMKELRTLIHQLSDRQSLRIEAYPDDIQRILIQLSDQGVENIYLHQIGEHLLTKWKESKEEIEFLTIREWTLNFLKNKIAPIQGTLPPFTKKFVNVVGPTGVGKTTTLAKCASLAVLEQRKKIAFITTDTYRIAAIEQLKTYGNLLNVPVEVVYKLSDFQKAVEKFNDFDHIFIDTAGRNYRDPVYVEELKKVIDFDEDMDTYLVLSLTAKQQDLEEIIEIFEKAPITQFIFTKMDETRSCGALFNLMMKYGKGVAFITNGQNVPDDLIEADAEIMTKLLLEVEKK